MVIIIKLGGAVITDKNKINTAKTEVIAQVMKEVACSDDKIILVHGAGSFGHVDAQNYDLRHGYSSSVTLENQLEGISKIKMNLKQLDNLICSYGHELKLYPCSVSISDIMLSEGDDEQEVNFSSVSNALSLGLMPVLRGDVVFDKITGFRVVSGDRIIKLLVRYLVERNEEVQVIFGSNTDGLYDTDPEVNTNAKLISHVIFSNLDQLIKSAGESAGVDVTGGMTGKLIEIKIIVELGVTVKLVNLSVSGRLQSILEGKETIATIFIPL